MNQRSKDTSGGQKLYNINGVKVLNTIMDTFKNKPALALNRKWSLYTRIFHIHISHIDR